MHGEKKTQIMLSESQNIEYKETWREENGGGVTATIFRKTIEDIINESGGNVGVNGGNDGGNVAVIQLTNRQKLILSYIAKSLTITAKQMAVMTDIPQRTIERELSTLQKLDIIRREGSPRTGSWVIINKALLTSNPL